MALPRNLTWDLANSKWAAQLDPVLANPMNGVNILKNVSLINGTTTINHLLGSKLQGWFLTRVRGAAIIYDQQDTNPNPQLTLVLVSNAAVIVDIGVF